MSQSGPIQAAGSPTNWETGGGDEPAEIRPRSLEPGETLGRYVVLYRLGSGGMGIVYAAYDPQLDRKVALKLLRRTSSKPERRKRAVDRLMREARAMARLTHPNVITVHDVAEYGGRIFVAMEYVDGVTLTRHLAAGEHDWRSILKLMVEAGRGLAAAHDGGLIHRDFKPDNVMLSRDKRVLVMDFGLARALEPDDAESAMPLSRTSTPAPRLEEEQSGVLPLANGVAAASRVAGTPGYMAPEQHDGQPTDARTDQFSFCVTLYEALYRQRPFRGDSPSSIVERIVQGRIEEPPPSHGVPNWLRSVVVRGLSHDPGQRWESMGRLLDALEDDPALKRRRWLTRGAVAGLVGATGLAVWAWRDQAQAHCEGAEERLGGIWDEGRRGEVESAFQAVDRPYAAHSLQAAREAMDRYSGQWVAMHEEACVANRVRGDESDDLFDLRMACLGRRRSELRALSDVLADADVNVVKEAVLATSKLTPLEVCADATLLRQPIPLPEDPKLRQRVEEVRDELARSKAHEDGGRYERSLEIVDAVLDDARAMDYPPVLAETLQRRGHVLFLVGNHRESEVALREAVKAAAAGRHDEVAALAWLDLTVVLTQGRGEVTRAEETAQIAATAVTRAGEPPELLAQLYNVRGAVHLGQGEYAKAQVSFEHALEHQKAAFHDDHPSIARILNNLAIAYGQQGDIDGSRKFLERAVELERRVLGTVHPRVAVFQGNMGAILMEQGELDQAEKALENSVDIWTRSLSSDHMAMAFSLNNLGSLRVMRRDYASGEAMFRRAIALQERLLGDHPDLARTLGNLAAALTRSGRHREALDHALRADEILSRFHGKEHPDLSYVLAARGEAELGLERWEEALQSFERALELREGGPGLSEESDFAWMRFGVARALTGLDISPGRARSLVKQARDGLPDTANHPEREFWLEQIETWLAEHPGDDDANADDMPSRFGDAGEWAAQFDAPSRAAWQKPDQVVARLGLEEDSVVADLGAGTGYFAVRMARAVPRGKVYGQDIEPSMIDYMRDRAKREGLDNLHTVLGERRDAKLPEKVDVVFICNTAHHLPDRSKYFARLRKQLRPGGKVVVVDFHPEAPEDAPGPGKEHRLSPEELTQEMSVAGYGRTELEEELLPYQYVAIFE